MSRDVDLTWEQDQKVVEYVNLAYSWRKFRQATIALDDKLAAIREADHLLAGVV